MFDNNNIYQFFFDILDYELFYLLYHLIQRKFLLKNLVGLDNIYYLKI